MGIITEADEANIRQRVSELSLDDARAAYKRVNEKMLDDELLDIDEHTDKVRRTWIRDHGYEGLGKAMSSDFQSLIDKYGGGMITLRWELRDHIEELEGERLTQIRKQIAAVSQSDMPMLDAAREVSRLRAEERALLKDVSQFSFRDPRQLSLFPEAKEGDLFGPDQGPSRPPLGEEKEIPEKVTTSKEKVTTSIRGDVSDVSDDVRRVVAHFPMETPEESASFDKRVGKMSDAELLAYMEADGNGDVNKAYHPSVYDEYDYRHGDELADAYDRYLQGLHDSNTTLDQAEEMLGNLRKDLARLATDERAELLGQEEALQEYVEELEISPDPTLPGGEGVDGKDDILPVGHGAFGDIYDQFKGKPKEAVDFLLENKSGDLLGVFHRDGFGDIDLAWGNKDDNAGLEHIISKHVGRNKDFADTDELSQTMDDVIKNGDVIREKWDKAIFEKDGKRVVVRKNLRDKEGNIIEENKNWVVTSYDKEVPLKKKQDSASTLATPESGKGGRAVTSKSVSEGKDSENASKLQEKVEKNTVQGIDGYDADEVMNAVRGDIEMRLEDAGLDSVSIKGMALHGSRMRGDAREDSDLDVVVEYEGDISEDSLFNILNEDPIEIEGITVDVNPITKGKSGTLEEYMKRSRKYDEEVKDGYSGESGTLRSSGEGKGVFKERLAQALEETNTEPTDGQKEAGNYRKGHLQFGGYNFTVENPKGSVRSGVDADGNPWSVTMNNTYGYIRGTEGVDGDHIDVFINDDADLDLFGNNGNNGKIYIIDQVNADGSFDEHKIMWGFANEVDAIRNYLLNYSRPWHGLGNITGVDKATFDKWVASSGRKVKPFAETRFGDSRDVVSKVLDAATLSRQSGHEGDGERFSVPSAKEQEYIKEKDVQNIVIDSAKERLPKTRTEALAAIPQGGVLYHNDDQSVEIRVGKKSLRHSNLHDNDDICKAYGKIGEIIRNAVKIGEEAPKADEKGHTHSVSIYYVPVNIDGAQYLARMVVKQYENKDNVLDEFSLYNIAMHKEKATPHTNLNATGGSGVQYDTALSAYKVKELIHSTQENDQKLLGIDANSTKFSLVDNNEKPSEEKTKVIFDTAKKKFGTTYDIREAGYVLPDGTMLDFSGRHELFGADDSGISGRRTSDHREISSISYVYDKDGNEVETGVETSMPDFIERGAIRIDNNAGTINLIVKPTKEQRDVLARLIRNNGGDVTVDFGNGWDTEHSVEYYESKYPRILNDISRYFDEGIKPEGNQPRFSVSGAPFYSNAEKAVDGIKQEKATPEQWLKMIEKNGGLKKEEDKWMGLSDFLKDKKSVTKDEVLNYIRENKIEVYDVTYSEGLDERAQNSLYELNNEFQELFSEAEEETGSIYLADYADWALKKMVERYGDDFEYAFEVDNVDGEYKLAPSTDWNGDISDAALYYLDAESKPIDDTRLEYTTDGLENKREIALVVPSIEAWNESDTVHFGDAGEGRAVAWVRFGDATIETTAEGLDKDKYTAVKAKDRVGYNVYRPNGSEYGYIGSPDKQHCIDAAYKDDVARNRSTQRVLVIDEIQSKRHQEGREKGYQPNIKELKKQGWSISGDEKTWSLLTPEGEMYARYPKDIATNEQEVWKYVDSQKMSYGLGVPDAPFQKNWHELAMKRMLRYAAENGYDKIAWTKGAQQADRYDIRNVVEDLYYKKNEDGTYNISLQTKDSRGHGDGRYDDYGVQAFPNQSETDLSNLLGKEVAQKIIEGKGRKGYTHNGETGWTTFKGNDLKIGGEGMKGFYDQILPRFMDKYGKRWGVKTGEIELPNVEEAGRKMWSVDVTSEMKESVMQGQPMFSFDDGSDVSFMEQGFEQFSIVRRPTNNQRKEAKEKRMEERRREQAKAAALDAGIREPSREQYEARAHREWVQAHREWVQAPDASAEPNEWDFEVKAQKEFNDARKRYEEKLQEYMPKRSDELTADDVIVEREQTVHTPAQRMTNKIVDVMATERDPLSARDEVKGTVIQRRKDIEELSADDSIYINNIRRESDKLAMKLSGLKEKEDQVTTLIRGMRRRLGIDNKEDMITGKDIREALPYIIEAEMRRRDIADEANMELQGKGSPARLSPDDIKAAEDDINGMRDNANRLLAVQRQMEEEGRITMSDSERQLRDDVYQQAHQVANIINMSRNGRGREVTADDIMATLSIVTKRVMPEGLKLMEYKDSEAWGEVQGLIGSIKDWYAVAYGWLEDAGLKKEGIGYYKDYVNHVWDRRRSDPEAWDTYVANRQPTTSKNMRKREIRTLMDGLELGLVPKYDDIADLMGDYSKSNILAWANKKMLRDLSFIDIVERGEDGEVKAMVPMLSTKAPNAFEIGKYDYYEIPGVGSLWVHKAVSKNFGLVFESYQPGKMMGTYDKFASIAKNIELAWSGFHAAALSEVYVAQNIMHHPVAMTRNFWKYLVKDALVQGQPPAYTDPELYKDAAKHLVKLGATGDYAPEALKDLSSTIKDSLERVRRNLMQRGAAGKVAGVGVGIPEVIAAGIKLVNEGMDKALWSWLHDGLKLCQYQMFKDDIMAKAEKQGWNQERIDKALDEAGQYINDEFGGQHFEVINISPKTLRRMRRFLLSPDWLLSTQRHFLGNFGFGSIYNKANIRNFMSFYKNVLGKGEPNTGQYDGRYQRAKASIICYGLGCVLMYPLMMNALNALMRKMDEEYELEKEKEIEGYVSKYRRAYPDGMKGFEIDNLSLDPFNSFNIFGDYGMGGNAEGKKSHLFFGRYGDDTEMYIRWGKQFREFPELFENEQGDPAFPSPLLKRLMGKSNPNIRFLYDTLNYYTRWDKSKNDEDLEDKWRSWIGDGKLQRNFAIPMAVGSEKLLQNYMPFWVPTQSDKEWKPSDMILPSTKGFTPYKARNYFTQFIKVNDVDGIKETFKAAVLNGMTQDQITRAYQAAEKTVQNESRDFMEKNGNQLQSVVDAFDASNDLSERKQLNSRIRKMLAAEAETPQTWDEFWTAVEARRDGTTEGATKATEKYLMVATSDDILEDARLAQLKKKAAQMKREHDEMKDNKADQTLIRKWEQKNQKWLDVQKMIKEGESGSDEKRGTLYWKKKMSGDAKKDGASLERLRKKRKEVLAAAVERLR